MNISVFLNGTPMTARIRLAVALRACDSAQSTVFALCHSFTQLSYSSINRLELEMTRRGPEPLWY